MAWSKRSREGKKNVRKEGTFEGFLELLRVFGCSRDLWRDSQGRHRHLFFSFSFCEKIVDDNGSGLWLSVCLCVCISKYIQNRSWQLSIYRYGNIQYGHCILRHVKIYVPLTLVLVIVFYFIVNFYMKLDFAWLFWTIFFNGLYFCISFFGLSFLMVFTFV